MDFGYSYKFMFLNLHVFKKYMYVFLKLIIWYCVYLEGVEFCMLIFLTSYFTKSSHCSCNFAIDEFGFSRYISLEDDKGKFSVSFQGSQTFSKVLFIGSSGAFLEVILSLYVAIL